MAQFIEVMRQAKRMCAAHGGMCNYRNCPLDNGKNCRLLPAYDDEDYNELERIIMSWAVKNPEPVYSSWIDSWFQLFPDAKDAPCPKYFFADKCKYEGGMDCITCKMSPIPAEIAKKLGIKPIDDYRVAQPSNYCPNCGQKLREFDSFFFI